MSFLVSFSQKLSMASRLYAPVDGFSVWFLWRRPRGTLPSGSTTSSSFSSSSISSGDRVDSRLSMSGSSLTCRRYLATLDILAKWAAALVGLQGLGGWDGAPVWMQQTPAGLGRGSPALPAQVPKRGLGAAASGAQG